MPYDPSDTSFAAEGQVPSEFTGLVRDALAHLYDPAHLLRHPLCHLLARALPSGGNTAQSLRAYLLDAIECLAPPTRTGGAGPSEKDQRPYVVLVQRYVGGMTVDECAAQLHLSSRQVRREHETGVVALAAYLWRVHQSLGGPHGPQGAGGNEPAAEVSPTGAVGEGLTAELAALGVELASYSLVELASSVASAARALSREYGVRFILLQDGEEQSPAEDVRCLCDRTLARQALLASMQALVGGHPGRIEVTAMPASGRARPRPALRLATAVPVDLSAGERAALELDRAQAFMAAQDGELKLLEIHGSLCQGVELLFRPESRARVLLVDDNENLLQLYARYLSMGSYETKTATSAAEAESCLEQEEFDAVILDVMMRGEDGWELLERVRANSQWAEVPVIVCSVLDEPKLAALLGAQAYLHKPVVSEDLLAALEGVLARRQGQ